VGSPKLRPEGGGAHGTDGGGFDQLGLGILALAEE